jgi:hypothetical protein
MSLRSDMQQNIQTELDFSSRQRVKPAKREGKRLNRSRRRMTPKAQPARID